MINDLRAAYLPEWKESQFGKLPARWQSSTEYAALKPTAKVVLAAITTWIDGKKRQGWASYNQIAALAACCRRSAIYGVKQLIEAGFLVKRWRFHDYGDMAANMYALHAPASQRDAAQTGTIQALSEEWSAPEKLPRRRLVKQEAAPEAAAPGSPARDLVVWFHVQNRGIVARHYTPSPKEVVFVDGLLADHGVDNVQRILAYAVDRFGSWQAGSIFAIKRHIAEALVAIAPQAPTQANQDDAEALRQWSEMEAATLARQEAARQDAIQAARAAVPGLLARIAEMEGQIAVLPSVTGTPIQMATTLGTRSAIKSALRALKTELQHIDSAPDPVMSLVQIEAQIDALIPRIR